MASSGMYHSYNQGTSWGNRTGHGQQRRTSSVPSPSTSTAPHPQALMSGFTPSTIHKSDLFFASPPSIPLNRSRTVGAPPPPPSPPPPLPPKPNSEPIRPEFFLEKLSSQEEDDLARALEESLHSSHSVPGPSRSRRESPLQSVPSSPNTDWLREASPVVSLPSSSLEEDEAMARRLAAEEEEEDERYRRDMSGPSIEDDEAFARRLAMEEEQEEQKECDDDRPNNAGLPTYADVVSPPPDSPSLRSNSNDSTASKPSSSDYLSAHPLRPNRPVSVGAISETSLLHTSSSAPSSASLSSLNETEESNSSDANASVVNVNQFVDTELLRGVSIGFVAPVISQQIEPMQGIMPNIVTLPHGRCPPLHLQATSWRHLLKLMARLSGTRIQPTVDALAQRADLKLRTVIQFVRPHYTSHDWRTVIWFTIDEPLPPAKILPRRYTTSDVDTLPFSYTKSTLPTLLRDDADTPISKKYTVPSTENMPYPVLPITFPNLALYLQAALDESRRYLNDSSSGMRKLAKMIETCYPNEFDAGGSSGEGRGMGRFLKKAIGRGSKGSKKKGCGGNEDTYELVTPFVPDEWS